MWSSLRQTFGPTLPHNPYQTLCSQRKFIWIQVSALFYTTPCGLSTRLTSSQYSPLPIPHWFYPLYLYPPHTYSLPHSSIFSNHIPISHTWQLTTYTADITFIYGARMSSQHSKPTCIHNNTSSSSFRNDRETSVFHWDS